MSQSGAGHFLDERSNPTIGLNNKRAPATFKTPTPHHTFKDIGGVILSATGPAGSASEGSYHRKGGENSIADHG